MKYYPTPDWNSMLGVYSTSDIFMIAYGFFAVCRNIQEQLAPFIGQDRELFQDLSIKFVPEQDLELKRNNALGISFPNRNTNIIPPNLNRYMMTIYSGIYSMELVHSVIARLTGSMIICNDTVHYVYNVGRLKKIEYRTADIIKNYGGALEMVVPDLQYLWVNKDKIMDDVKNGRAPAGHNPYWSGKGNPDGKPIVADWNELEEIKNWLIYKDVRGASSYLKGN